MTQMSEALNKAGLANTASPRHEAHTMAALNPAMVVGRALAQQLRDADYVVCAGPIVGKGKVHVQGRRGKEFKTLTRPLPRR